MGENSALDAQVEQKDAEIQRLLLLGAERAGQISFLREQVTELALSPKDRERRLAEAREALARCVEWLDSKPVRATFEMASVLTTTHPHLSTKIDEKFGAWARNVWDTARALALPGPQWGEREETPDVIAVRRPFVGPTIAEQAVAEHEQSPKRAAERKVIEAGLRQRAACKAKDVLGIDKGLVDLIAALDELSALAADEAQ